MSQILSQPSGLSPYLVDEADENTTYICFDDSPKTIIHRVKKTGTVTEYTYTYGAWSNRASIASDKWVPINSPLEI